MVRILFLVLIHAFGDFFLQGVKLSKLKATNLFYLFEHVGIYTLLFIVASPFLLGLTFIEGLYFSILNGFLHFVVDYFTGKLKRKLRPISESKYIMVVLIDHAIHITILIVSYIYLYPAAFKAIIY